MLELTLKGSHTEVIQLMRWIECLSTINSVTFQGDSSVKCHVKLNQLHKMPNSTVEMKTESGADIQIQLSDCEMVTLGKKTVLRGKHYDIF
ncbi:hypothetical protein [Risungbinella massiliensis]|uniref:hypothetical protein n=1 Tax=Risungbinella massiliensis TaxID=1329796 RepID=UPI0011CC1062|nr:hypothetical protein [Risungbinella massiliensis]